nr:restriction endonuclease subunit S [uncultured Pseudodesulfovibrio sp.]
MSNKAEPMKKESKRTLVPQRRFPEFRDEPGWLEKTGDKLFDQINDRNHASSLPVLAITQEHGAIPRDMIDYKVAVTKKSIKNYKVVQVGDFIISLRSFQGGIEYSKYHGICSPAYVILRKCIDGSNAYFKHYLKTDRFIRILTRNLEGLRDGKMISYKQFSEVSIPVPRPPEQNKIADCLSSLDELIAAENRKLETLRDHKCGLMQRLFPQPGETQPRLRFPEFRGKGEWGKSPLGKLLSRKPEYGVNAPAVPFSKDLPAYIRITDIDDEGQFIKTNRVSVSIEVTEKNYLAEGDIALARTGASVGKSYQYRPKDGPLVFAGFLIRVRPNPKKLTPDFLTNYLGTWGYWDWVRINSVRGGQPGINGNEYSSLPIPLPPTGAKGNELAEQEKIADCLTALDTQITTQASKIEVLKQHKLGLMQQLFPEQEVQ